MCISIIPSISSPECENGFLSKNEQPASLARPMLGTADRAQARMARGPSGRASTGHRACLMAQAPHMGRFLGWASPKSTRPNSPSGRPMTYYMKNIKFNKEFNKT